MSDIRAASVTVELAALLHNFSRIKELVPHSKLMPVIKANAYGHGMIRVARALAEADGFSVAQLKEALGLRAAGINKPLTVFQGFQNLQDLELIFQHHLRPAVSQLWQIELLEQYKGSASVDVWLKVNSGMGRLGVQADEVEEAWQRLNALKCVATVGLMTHYANADIAGHLSNQQQTEVFRQLHQTYSAETSVSNSAAIVSQLYPDQDWVRPGIMLYGASPLQGVTADQLGLRPVMQVQATLIAINKLKKGQSVGYGDRWVCPEDMPVGIVNIGYGDGYPRQASEQTPVLINQQKTHLIGRVSMDSIAIDLRDISAQCGDRVELWGIQLSVDDIADHSQTISYELLCRLGNQLDIQ